MDKVFEIPDCWNCDGLNLHGRQLPTDIDEVRLNNQDTVLIATYPRTGTTWLTHIVSLLQAGEENYDKIKKINIFERVPYVEYVPVGGTKQLVYNLDFTPKPCVLKCHLPYRFIKRWIGVDKVKTIVTTRNPKDSLVSMFHLYRTMTEYGFSGTWDEFFNHVKAGKQLYGDQLDWYRDWEKQVDNPNILFLKYEDMKSDTLSEIQKIVTFLELDCSQAFQEKVARDSDIKVMKADDTTNFNDEKYVKIRGEFIRKGSVGEWCTYFTVDQNEWFDDKYKNGYEQLKMNIHF